MEMLQQQAGSTRAQAAGPRAGRSSDHGERPISRIESPITFRIPACSALPGSFAERAASHILPFVN